MNENDLAFNDHKLLLKQAFEVSKDSNFFMGKFKSSLYVL